MDPPPLCTWEGEGHILAPSRLDSLPPCKGAEEGLKSLPKDEATEWGNGKTEQVKYSLRASLEMKHIQLKRSYFQCTWKHCGRGCSIRAESASRKAQGPENRPPERGQCTPGTEESEEGGRQRGRLHLQGEKTKFHWTT